MHPLRTLCFVGAVFCVCSSAALAQSTPGQPIVNAVSSPQYIDASVYKTPTRDESQAINAAVAGCVASTGPAGSVGCSIKSPFTGYQPWSTNPFSGIPNGVDLDLSVAGVHDVRLQSTLFIPQGTHIHGATVPGSSSYYGVYLRACNPTFMSGSAYGTACTPFSVNSATVTAVSTSSGLITVTATNSLTKGQHAFIYDGTDPNALTGMFLVASIPMMCMGSHNSCFTIAVPSTFSLTSCSSHCGTLYEGTPLIQLASGQVFDTEIDHLVLDCGWVRGCEPYVNATGEEQDQIHDIEIWNWGGAGLFVDELSFLPPAAYGVTSTPTVSLGAINSGPWARGSIHFQNEVCELSAGCSGLVLTPITATSITSNVLTVTVLGGGLMRPGQTLLLSGTAEGFLNGQTVSVVTSSAGAFTANFSHANYTNNSDSGTGTVTMTQGQSFDGSGSLPQVANCSTFGILASGSKKSDVRQYSGWTIAFSHPNGAGGVELVPETETMGWTGYTSCASGNGPGPGSSAGHFVYGQLAHFTDNHTEFTPTAYLIGNSLNHNLYWANANAISSGLAVTNVKIENEEFCITGICNTNDGNNDYTIVIGPNSENVQIENTNNGGPNMSTYFISDESTGNTCQGSGNWAQAWYWLGPVISGQPTPVMSSCQGITNQFAGPVSLGNVGSPLLQPWTNASGGTVNAHLAKITASDTVVEVGTSDITADGIVYSGAGTSMTAQMAVGGTVNCVFDGGSPSVGDYVQISNTTTSVSPVAGACHDSGLTYPNNGGVVIGKVATTPISGAANITIDLQPPSPLSAMNPQTATYQVLASDFANYKTITVGSGTFTITLVASTSQPASGQYINIVNYGAGTVTIARSGQNINGSTSSLILLPASATSPTSATIWSDGTNYFASIQDQRGIITSIPSSDTINEPGMNTAFATTISVPGTGLTSGSLLTIHGHGTYVTGSGANRINLQVNAGGGVACPAGTAGVPTTNQNPGYWELTCYIQIGSSGNAIAWGNLLVKDGAGTTSGFNLAFLNSGTITYTTSSAQTASIEETTAMVLGQSITLQAFTIHVDY